MANGKLLFYRSLCDHPAMRRWRGRKEAGKGRETLSQEADNTLGVQEGGWTLEFL